MTSGNNLNQSMWVVEPSTSDSGFSVSVVVSRSIVEAQYSVDTNTTTFTYILSTAQYTIQQVGDFPNDKWEITIQLETNFNVTFDQHPKFCVTPSSSYYGTYTAVPVSGEQDYLVNLELLHAPSFSSYVDEVFLLPIILLAILILACIAIAVYIGVMKRKILDKFYNSFITICSAVIVFIPIFQLSTQDLKMPNLFTKFDWAFIILLFTYIAFLVSLLIVKALAKVQNKKGHP